MSFADAGATARQPRRRETVFGTGQTVVYDGPVNLPPGAFAAAPGQPSTTTWLVRLRWVLIASQLCALAAAQLSQGATLQWLWLGPLVGVAAASNLALQWATRVGQSPSHSRALVGSVLVLDALLFTGILATTGGSSNPFTVMYLVQIVLAAVVLDSRWTTAVTLLCAGCFAVLFALPPEEHVHHHEMHAGAFSNHLVGMWVAFALAAAVIAYSVRRIALMREQQQRQIVDLRVRGEAAARMASLTTLAAGAAHELRTPMSTIAVAAYELLQQEAKGTNNAAPDERAEDLKLILQEVERCQEILDGMGLRFSEQQIARPADCRAVLDAVLRRSQAFGSEIEIVLAAAPSAGDASVLLVEADLITSLCALVQNAVAASLHAAPVRLSAELSPGWVDFVVVDQGAGMDEFTLARATEPFFTTKEAGQGMGLGLFLANTCALGAGGELQLTSSQARGTRAVLRLPRFREQATHPQPAYGPDPDTATAPG